MSFTFPKEFMATPKPQGSKEELEDMILRKIFLVSLTEPSKPDSGIIYLEMTAAKILSEGKELKLSIDLLKPILIDERMDDFCSFEQPFQYLVGCYRRAHDECEKIASVKDKKLRIYLKSLIKLAKKLAVSCCRIHMGSPEFPRPGGNSNNMVNTSPLLRLIFSEVSDSVDRFGGSLGFRGFLNDFFGESDFDMLDPILKELYERLRELVLNVPAHGNFEIPLRALLFLVSFPAGAKSLVNHPRWIPGGLYLNGRDIENSSILGPFFHISALSDYPFSKTEFFSEGSNTADSYRMIKAKMNKLYDGLTEVFRKLLKNPDTKEKVLEYLAVVINLNSSRACMLVDPFSCASLGTFVSLSAVMLRLCKPLLDANLSKIDKISPTYVFSGNRVELRSLTALHATSDEVTEWISEYSMKSGKYSFLCECFFLTARVLNLGLFKAFSDYRELVEEISRNEEVVNAIINQRLTPQLNTRIAQVKRNIKSLKQEMHCYDAQILKDEQLVQQAISFYRLMVVWLGGLVGGFKMPLPSPCPVQFASMPEHFVEDAMELLIVVSGIPKAVTGILLDDFMNFIVMFMASPEYIRSPYLRSKMVEVLNCLMPVGSRSSTASPTLFEGNKLSLKYLVKNLLKLYVDIEYTGFHTQFHDKFTIRHNIAQLLKYLWQVPSYRNTWKKVAKKEEKHVYLNFLNFLMNDSIYLLDESFKTIVEHKQLKAEMSKAAEWKRSVTSRQT